MNALPRHVRHGARGRGLAFVLLALLSGACLADEARVLGKGIVSTAAVEYGAAVDPINGALYFVRTDAPWGTPGCGRILVSLPNEAEWSEPSDFLAGNDVCYGDPFVSPDGQQFFFTSNAHEDPERSDDDIWSMRRTASGWSKPARVDGLNSTAAEFSPVSTRSGTLYFASDRPGGSGSGDLWRARRLGTRYAQPENLGTSVNSEHGEWNLFVDPEEEYLLFESSGRAGAMSAAGDLYRSWRRGDSWSVPMPVVSINTSQSELMPRPSLDGQLLYIARSNAQGGADILEVPVSLVLEGRESAF
ncbi:hypothetical protein [Dokdonella sp.]|uniref:hypothetical protein n=1 Tax=Dokdonella sp. TaxID=2291710 RepID=UPI003526FB64